MRNLVLMKKYEDFKLEAWSSETRRDRGLIKIFCNKDIYTAYYFPTNSISTVKAHFRQVVRTLKTSQNYEAAINT